MTHNKAVVARYMDGFNKSDHAAVLSCLAENVVWDLPGSFHLVGKAAFDKEMENDAFVGSPSIVVTRMVEEGDVVVAEGAVRSMRKDDRPLNAVFCDVFELAGGKVVRLTSYVTEMRQHDTDRGYGNGFG